ncbi:MAG: tRNA pseudouridine(55) synthase TruB [Alphaproteobacteria bacterium]|nr:tRNA pseudouridine(55) synthase TruB [Alphaproteobacteria bacterium]
MGRKKKGIPLHGWLNIDKPMGMTSTQVIGRVRRLTNAQKLGHAGTLDPLATGVLPIALGEGTKTIPYAQDADKIYRFTITWGDERNTDDCEGETTATADARPVEEDIRAIIPQFTGDIEQVPPQFSAVKIDGQRAYALARKGEEVAVQPRIVTVYDLQLLETDTDSAIFEMQCGKGTYVRSIARDMGRILGCYGHISALRRTTVGVFSEEDAIPLDEFEKMLQSAPPEDLVLPLETVLDDIPALVLTAEEVSRVRHGQGIRLLSRTDLQRLNGAGIDAETDTVLALDGDMPVGLLQKDGPALNPARLFNL